MSPPGVSEDPEACILGLDALRELYEGLLDRLTGGAASSEGDDRVVVGRVGRPPRVGTQTSLLTRRPGKTLFLIPNPVNVSPLSGNRMGRCTALPVFSRPKLDSISIRSGVKLDSHRGITSSGSGGGSGYPCSCEY